MYSLCCLVEKSYRIADQLVSGERLSGLDGQEAQSALLRLPLLWSVSSTMVTFPSRGQCMQAVLFKSSPSPA